MANGPKSKITPEIFEALLVEIRNGAMMAPAAKKMGFTPNDVNNFLMSVHNPEARAQYNEAKAVREDVLLDEMVDIADTGDKESEGRNKLQIWAREKHLAMSNPMKYSAKSIQVTNAAPLVVSDRTAVAILGDDTPKEDE